MIPVIGAAIPWLMRDPKRVKYALIGALTIAALWSFRVWLVARDERAAAQAKIKQIEQITKDRQKELDARAAELTAKAEALDAAEASLEAQREALGKSRITIKTELAQGLNGLKSELSRVQGEISAVPSDQVVARFRAELEALR